jgi:L-asparagine transporter-like permease
MEFFIPGLLLFLFTIIVTVVISPTSTPLIAAILSIIFLTYGVYDHYQLFASEYRLSTWQDGIKIYAPFLMIAAIILYIIYGIMMLFTGGEVPIPNVEMPEMGNTGSGIVNQISNFTTNLKNTVSNKANELFPLNRENNKNIKNNKNNQPKPNSGMSRSLFETL